MIPGPVEWVRSIRSQCSREWDQQDERAPADAFFKVPPVQKKANPQAYEPHMFTFGPYLARFDQEADRFKVQVVQGLRVAEGGFQRLVSAMEQHDSEVRALYVDMQGEMARIDSNTLACLLAVDSLVIVAAVNLCGPLHVRNIVAMDAMLLENQVPFFALRHAVETLCPDQSRRQQKVLMKLLNLYYTKLFPNLDNYARLSESLLPSDPADDSGWNKPLLAYIYDALTKQASPHHSSNEPDDLADLEPQLPTSSHLVKYGFTFSPSNTNFTGIRFDENTLTLSLPLLDVDDSTQRFILNLLAYEATSTYPSRRCAVVISYLYFMDRLIDSGEDARLLVEAGVIRNHLGSPEELASMWNKMCVFVICSSTSADREVMEKVIKAARVKSHRWIAAFRETYYEKKPWLIISIVAALMLLVLTFLQTFYTMKPYFT